MGESEGKWEKMERFVPNILVMDIELTLINTMHTYVASTRISVPIWSEHNATENQENRGVIMHINTKKLTSKRVTRTPWQPECRATL